MAEPIKIQFRPGINRETTDYGNTGGWYDINLARWVSGTPQSMGGWQRFTSAPVQGTMRSLFPWSTLNGAQYYATGTNLKYYIIRGNEPIDVTPIRRTVTLANDPFAVTNGSSLATVTDVANGSVVGDFVTYSGATTIGGNVTADVLNQEYQIVTIVDDDHYTITLTVTSNVTDAAGGGAAVQAVYQINVGLNTASFGNGWGTGPWGREGWGEGSDTSVQTDQLRLWTQDNYGEDLLFNPRDGGIYYKDMSGSIADRGVNITSLSGSSNAPTVARQVLVSNNDRHVLAFAANTLGTSVQDRLLARWSDAESLIQWTPDTTNTAGSIRFDVGSEFMCAVETTTEILVFTDTALASMRFIGPPFTFGQTLIATNIQIIGPNAVTTTGAVTAWMANGLFQWYDGVVHDMPCDIRTYVFGILNASQSFKIFAGVNRQFKEFIWLMPVNGSEQNNFYVICNYENPSDPIWYYGSYNEVGRSTWMDAFFERTPLAGAPDGYIYAHDLGATDMSVEPAVILDSYLKSSVFELGNGENFMLVSRLIPDVSFAGSTATNPAVNITFAQRDYPGSAFVEGPDDPVARSVALPVEQYTTKVDKRWRSRSTQIGIEPTEVGTMWTLGVPRLYANSDGQR
jgi:hypothetical protein